ncbi:threonine/serine exporter family protein [Arcanobacterium haemolyticum]|nr:threonine/serine exporter family protein [Arcanobacterium haemolyticum]
MLLSAGASSFRVKDGMARLAKAVGIEEHHAQVTYTEITTTAYANGTFRTELAEQRAMGVDAARIDQLNYFVKTLPERMLVEQAEAELDKIASHGPLYSPLVSSLASGFACAGFCFLNKGGIVECFAVLIAAFFGQRLRKFLMKRRVNHFGVWLLCGVAAVSIYILLVWAMHQAGWIDATHSGGSVSAVLFLVPGFPLVTSILDLIRQDFSAGISRGVYVAMLLIASAAAVWGTTAVFHWSVLPVDDTYHVSGLILLGLRALTTFVAAYGFAMLFNAPQKACALAALIGLVINTGRLTAQDFGFPWLAAVGCAALAAGLLADLFSTYTKYSRVTLSVPAVVVMIPGVPLYRAGTAISNGEVGDALSQVVTVILVIASIGVGLAVARMATDRNWLMDSLHPVPSLGDSATTIPAKLAAQHSEFIGDEPRE